jgi:hypothetical protein
MPITSFLGVFMYKQQHIQFDIKHPIFICTMVLQTISLIRPPIKRNQTKMGFETLAIKISDQHNQSTDSQNVEAPHYAERT